MAETDTDIVANRRDRVSTLRKRGRISDAALAVVPAEEVDVRRGRPPAPERLSEAERELWDKLTFSRRPGCGRGNASGKLRDDDDPVPEDRDGAAQDTGRGARYQKLAQLHRQTAALAARWPRG